MSSDAQPDKLSLSMAEEVLRTIYGDDLKGCTVTLDQIAGVLRETLLRKQGPTRELLELYDKVIEAIHILSTPPEAGKVSDPNELRSLLGQRLDAIHAITKKTIETIRVAKAEGE
jgi:hypothetical protein